MRTKKQPFNPIPLILIGITSGGFAFISILSINWKSAEIQATNNPKLPSPIQITIPTTNEESQPSEEEKQEIEPDTQYEATVFVPRYKPILPSGVQKNSDAWFCWQHGGGQDCLLRDWNYSPPPQPLTEWERYELEQQQKNSQRPKTNPNGVRRLLKWIP